MTISDATQKLLNHPKALCNMVRRVAVEAGDAVLAYYDESGCDSTPKGDGSPCTIADHESERIILERLGDIAPDIPVIAEEAVERGHVPDLTGAEWFWLVDPLDGTKEFETGGPDFTVNIALIHNGIPVTGVVFVPVTGELYAGCGPESAVKWNADTDNEKPIRVREAPARGLTVVASKHHDRQPEIEVFLKEMKIDKVIRRASSVKICAIAAGKADLYPRLGPTSEWDIAAGDAILRSAGGKIVDMQGNPLTYGHAKRKFLNGEFIASSGFWPVDDAT